MGDGFLDFARLLVHLAQEEQRRQGIGVQLHHARVDLASLLDLVDLQVPISHQDLFDHALETT